MYVDHVYRSCMLTIVVEDGYTNVANHAYTCGKDLVMKESGLNWDVITLAITIWVITV